MATTQNLLFTEPLYTETGLWCELADGIDPARWAKIARRLGNLSPVEFKRAEKCVLPDPDSLKYRLKSLLYWIRGRGILILDFGHFLPTRFDRHCLPDY